jgi:hypothetical protein
MVSPTLQRHQDPILLLPWLWFEVADQPLTLPLTLTVSTKSRMLMGWVGLRLHLVTQACSARD